jgi:hypothetical protein
MFLCFHPKSIELIYVCFVQAQIPSLHNMNGLFRIIVTLDAGTCKLMNEDAIKIIAGYLIDAAMVCTLLNSKALDSGICSQ